MAYPVDTLTDVFAAYGVRAFASAYEAVWIAEVRRSSDDATAQVLPDPAANYVVTENSPIVAGGTLGSWAGASSLTVVRLRDQSDTNADMTENPASGIGEPGLIFINGTARVKTEIGFGLLLPAHPSLHSHSEFTVISQINSLAENSGNSIPHFINLGSGSTNEAAYYLGVREIDPPDFAIEFSVGEGGVNRVQAPYSLGNEVIAVGTWSVNGTKSIYLDGTLGDSRSDSILMGGDGQDLNLGEPRPPGDGYSSGFVLTSAEIGQAQVDQIQDYYHPPSEAGELEFTGDDAIFFAHSELPAEGATVYAFRPGEVEAASTGTTDASGEVTLTGLPAGTYATWAERDDGTGNIQTTQVQLREVT